MIPYAKHLLDREDEEAVLTVLRSSRLTQGDAVPRLEAALCDLSGAKHAVCVANGTLALWAAFRALWEQDGSQLVTVPAITFVATANAAALAGHRVQIVDVRSDTWCSAPMPSTVQVTLGGYPADVLHNGWRTQAVDAAHGPWTLGPELCRTFSFHPAKGFTSAEGGAIVTNDEELAQRLRRLRDNGRDMPHSPSCTISGLNLRMDEMSAALGLSQLKKLDKWQARRRQIADYYRREFFGLPIRTQPDHPGHAYHLFILCVDRPDMSRDTVRHLLAERGVGTQMHYLPLYRLAPYKQDASRFPNSEAYAASALSIPMSHALTDGEVEHVAASVKAVLG